MKEISISIIQDSLHWHDPGANRAMYDEHFDKLEQTDLIVLPEMFSTGFSMHPEASFETMHGDTVAWMRQKAAEKSAVITGSLIMQLAQDNYVNRMIWAKPDATIEFYDKRHLFRFGGEHIHFNAGNQRVVVSLNGWRVALFICYDLRFPVWSRNRDDYDVAIFVANWPSARQFAWDSLLIARAIENQAYVIGVNRIGVDGIGNQFSGGSVILDPKGLPMASCEDRRCVLSSTLNMQSLLDFREKFPAGLDADEFEISS